MWARMNLVFPSVPFSRAPNRGPVAQLGARFHGMEEVVGSIPTRSTIFSSTYRVRLQTKKEGPRGTADLDCLEADHASKRKSYSTLASAVLSPTMSAPRSLPSV